MAAHLKRGIVDLSSVIWTCLLASEDKEFGRKVVIDDKTYQVNSASFGYENAVNHIVKAMNDLGLRPVDLILVMEGKNAKQERQNIFAQYKAGRDKCPEQYEQFNLCKEQVIDVFLKLGAQLCWQDGGVEADDVMGYLAQHLDGERWIISGDKDLAVMVGGDIHHYRRGIKDQNPFGPFAHRFIPVCIALVGDKNDNIKGAKGFAEKSFEKLLIAYGDEGLEQMEELIKTRMLRRLEEDVEDLPVLQKVMDDAENVYISYELARLRLEKVNTLRRPLSWKAGMVRSRGMCEDERLRKYAGEVLIVSAENYDEKFEWCKREIARSPFVALDIETSTPPASDEWLEAAGKADAVDVFGQELTSLQLTFGPNLQYTIYLPVDNVEEDGISNVTVEQVAEIVNLIPRETYTVIQNCSFELPICYMSWGEMWKDDPLYHGFLRNAIDSKIMSSYVDENRPAGLKENSKHYLGYEQATFKDVTVKDLVKAEWNGRGKVLQTYSEPQIEGDDVEKVIVQFKMNQLTAREVLHYGADDTICTAALAVHFRIRMEIEHTWAAFIEIEQFPAYLTALSYVHGCDFSLESMAEQEKDDAKAYDAAWPILRDYLIKVGFEGTVCPVYEEMTPATIKEALLHVTGFELKTMVRKPDKLAKLIGMTADEQDDGDTMRLFADIVAREDLAGMNALVAANFKGEPVLDLGSSKQIGALLYDHMNLPIHIVGDTTPIEREKQPELDAVVRKFKKVRAGTSSLEMTPEELKLLRKKAKANATAIDFAVAFDTEIVHSEAKAALQALGVMKKVMTRRSLFYANYWHALHWKDGKIHSSMNQCAAVTRRYSSSNPNLQQLPKKGKGVRFRSHFKPHKPNAVIASIDFVGQELRLSAERSQDKNLLACYVGDNLKDPHSITAAGAMNSKWGKEFVAQMFETYGPDLSRDEEGQYNLFLRLRALPETDPIHKKATDLRKDAKNVNFGAQNGAMAVKLSETIVIPLADATLFLEAREAMFPGVAVAAERAADHAKKTGCAYTMMGVPRHLREALLSDERGAADRAARQSWNHEIQGSAGEMSKLAMARIWKRGLYFKYDARFIAPIHDELVSSVVADDALDFLREKNECMTQPYATMTVPILGSISIGPNFADQIECGDWFIPERIQKALNGIFARKEEAVA